jgi:hypothetical protein
MLPLKSKLSEVNHWLYPTQDAIDQNLGISRHDPFSVKNRSGRATVYVFGQLLSPFQNISFIWPIGHYHDSLGRTKDFGRDGDSDWRGAAHSMEIRGVGVLNRYDGIAGKQ